MPTIPRLISMGILTVLISATVSCGASFSRFTEKEISKGTVVTYHYDVGTKNWYENVSLAASGESITSGTKTLIIQLQPDTPIQEIIIDEGLVIGGAAPIFEIDGDPDDSGGGAIRIGTLKMDTVDARRIEIRDTQVVSSNLTKVVAHDDELVLDIETVTVVFVEQGASSTLSLKNFRVDRIRILGSDGADTHLERFTVTRSSFVGSIRIEDAKIQNLLLSSVSLED